MKFILLLVVCYLTSALPSEDNLGKEEATEKAESSDALRNHLKLTITSDGKFNFSF